MALRFDSLHLEAFVPIRLFFLDCTVSTELENFSILGLKSQGS